MELLGYCMVRWGFRTLRVAFATSYTGWNYGRECSSNFVWSFIKLSITWPQCISKNRAICQQTSNIQLCNQLKNKILCIIGRHLNFVKGLSTQLALQSGTCYLLMYGRRLLRTISSKSWKHFSSKYSNLWYTASLWRNFDFKRCYINVHIIFIILAVASKSRKNR